MEQTIERKTREKEHSLVKALVPTMSNQQIVLVSAVELAGGRKQRIEEEWDLVLQSTQVVGMLVFFLSRLVSRDRHQMVEEELTEQTLMWAKERWNVKKSKKGNTEWVALVQLVVGMTKEDEHRHLQSKMSEEDLDQNESQERQREGG